MATRKRGYLIWGSAVLAAVVVLLAGTWWIAERNTDSESTWLFSHTADQGSLVPNPDGTYTLTLTGIDPHVVAFADRPVRDLDILEASELIDSWGDFFADSSPNAVLVEHNPRGSSDSVVLTIDKPRLTADPESGSRSLQYEAKLLTDEYPERLKDLSGVVHRIPPSRFEAASLFIDDVSTDSLGNGDAADTVPGNGTGQVAESEEQVMKVEQEEDLLTEERDQKLIEDEQEQERAEQEKEKQERKDLTRDMFP